jgi:hypothetical protein
MADMNTSVFLLGILPLLAFVIIDSFAGMKAALITAVVLALAEAGYSHFVLGQIDNVTIASFILVFLLAAQSWRSGSEKFFLFQPVILSGVLGTYLIVTYLMGSPLFLDFMMKYEDFFASYMAGLHQDVTKEQAIASLHTEKAQKLFSLMSLTSGISLYAHAAAVAFAALKLNKWWWIVIRIVAFYLFAFIAVMVASFITFKL